MMDGKITLRGPMGWREAIAAALLLTLLPLGCDREEGSPAPAPARSRPADAAHASTPAQRLATLSPLATRLILELGMASRIMAVDATSAELPGLTQRARIPDAEDAAVRALTAAKPDLVVVPASRTSLAQRLNAAKIHTVVVAVHDFDDAFTLWGELAERLGGAEASRARIADASRPLVEIAVESYGYARPRVAAIESFDPLVLVGDHQFATALIEIAGGESVTHGVEGPMAIERAGLVALAPELLFHATARALGEEERLALANSLAEIGPLVVVEFDPERFFAPETSAAARTLRDAIAPRARPLPASADSRPSNGGGDDRAPLYQRSGIAE